MVVLHLLNGDNVTYFREIKCISKGTRPCMKVHCNPCGVVQSLVFSASAFFSLEESGNDHCVLSTSQKQWRGWIEMQLISTGWKEMIQTVPSAIKVRNWKKLSFGIPKGFVRFL